LKQTIIDFQRLNFDLISWINKYNLNVYKLTYSYYLDYLEKDFEDLFQILEFLSKYLHIQKKHLFIHYYFLSIDIKNILY
jgi:hypothetical protein